MAEVINGILINEVETKNIMTKSSLPVGGYSVNPYVGKWMMARGEPLTASNVLRMIWSRHWVST